MIHKKIDPKDQSVEIERIEFEPREVGLYSENRIDVTQQEWEEVVDAINFILAKIRTLPPVAPDKSPLRDLSKVIKKK